MTLTFHAKTVAWLVLSSSLLGAGIYLAGTGQRALVFSQEQQQLVDASSKQLAQSRERADTYAALIDRIGWRPGQALRHETIDTSALIAGNEADRLNEILRANHVGRGQFFLRSLTIETIQPRSPDNGHVLKVSVKGDNILVLDRP